MLLKKIIHKVKTVVLTSEVKLLKARANQHGFVISEKEKVDSAKIVIENYFNTSYNKYALISYIIEPFLGQFSNRHTNQQECFAIAEILKELEYNVDIINGNNENFIPVLKYDLVIDNDRTLERLRDHLPSSCLKILHITHAHLTYQNFAEYKRIVDLQLRRSKSLKPVRYSSPSNSIMYCDFATCLAAQFTASTYKFAKKDIFYIPISTNFITDWNHSKDFSKYKNSYLWFGNTGALLKGLDLVLEAFAELPDFNLTVCFPLESEPEFVEVYYKELFMLPNIKTVGWVDTNSPMFSDLLNQNISIINASASEGGGGSIITCLQGGLIPIVSYESSVNIHDFGIQLNESSVEEIKAQVQTLSAKKIEQLESMSHKAFLYASKIHRLDVFKSKMKNIIQSRV